MAHIHGVTDIDSRFTIDPITRAIKNDALTKTTLIQGDHNSERFTFTLPRTIEGHDMATCNKVEVHFLNVDAETRQKSAGVYIVDDFQVDPDDDTKVVCSWLISGNATKYRGVLNFVVRYTCGDGENLDYIWSTAIYSGVGVSDGICNTENVLGEYLDVLEAWKAELYSHETVDVGLIDIDDVPTDGSPNLITSGGVKKYYDNAVNTKYTLTKNGRTVTLAGTDDSENVIDILGEESSGTGYLSSETGIVLDESGLYIFKCSKLNANEIESTVFTVIMHYEVGNDAQSQIFAYYDKNVEEYQYGTLYISKSGYVYWMRKSDPMSSQGIMDSSVEITCRKISLFS